MTFIIKNENSLTLPWLEIKFHISLIGKKRIHFHYFNAFLGRARSVYVQSMKTGHCFHYKQKEKTKQNRNRSACSERHPLLWSWLGTGFCDCGLNCVGEFQDTVVNLFDDVVNTSSGQVISTSGLPENRNKEMIVEVTILKSICIISNASILFLWKQHFIFGSFSVSVFFFNKITTN